MPDGRAVTNFSIATNRRWTDQASGQTREVTTWFRISLWGSRAEVANQYLSKGSPVLVEGRLRTDPDSGGPRIYTRQDGTVGASFEIQAYNFSFLGGGRQSGEFEESGDFESSTPAQEEDDIPF
jgi:single-strand DNA-binding protein